MNERYARPGTAVPGLGVAPGLRIWWHWVQRRPRLLLAGLVLLAALPGLFAMPPLDRDESRFAQATAQMLESGDFVSINFQDEPRNKKPVGIHWLQAASVWLTGQADAREIWAYRLPSLAGAILATLLTFQIGIRLFSRPIAFLSAAVLGTCIVLSVEAVNAKTDAVLLATVVLVQLALARLWMAPPGERVGIGVALLFWIGLGLGILVKGPLTPMVALLTVLALGLTTGRWRWLAPLRPLIGLPLLVVVVAPWFVAITLQDPGFLVRAAHEDLIPKLLSGVESHGQPPGFYLATHLIAFWPGALLAIPAVIAAWGQRRRHAALPFLLAWLIPSWLVFELTPPKLPHYVLPLYPALALLVGWAVVEGGGWMRGRLVKLLAAVTVAGALTIAVGVVALPLWLGDAEALGPAAITALLVLAAGLPTAVLAWRRRPLRALAWAVPLTAMVMAWGMGFYAPALQQLWISPRLAEAYASAAIDETPPLASAGYHEPSLVFLSGTRTALPSAPGAADYLARDPKALVAVTGREAEAFLSEAAAKGVTPVPRHRLTGVNYNKGRREEITLYGRAP